MAGRSGSFSELLSPAGLAEVRTYADGIGPWKPYIRSSRCIGVVGGKLVTTDLWNKLGVNWVGYKRGANADMLTSDKPFSDSQRQLLHDYMQQVYEVFKGHVTKGRGDKLRKPIDEIAGGGFSPSASTSSGGTTRPPAPPPISTTPTTSPLFFMNHREIVDICGVIMPPSPTPTNRMNKRYSCQALCI